MKRKKMECTFTGAVQFNPGSTGEAKVPRRWSNFSYTCSQPVKANKSLIWALHTLIAWLITWRLTACVGEQSEPWRQTKIPCSSGKLELNCQGALDKVPLGLKSCSDELRGLLVNSLQCAPKAPEASIPFSPISHQYNKQHVMLQCSFVWLCMCLHLKTPELISWESSH